MRELTWAVRFGLKAISPTARTVRVTERVSAAAVRMPAVFMASGFSVIEDGAPSSAGLGAAGSPEAFGLQAIDPSARIVTARRQAMSG